MTGVDLIAVERQRQISEKGYTAEHDDRHTIGELALAAVCYASPKRLYVKTEYCGDRIDFSDPWPWWEESTSALCDEDLSLLERITLLSKAGALIAAEIDRLERLRLRK